jgi:hypothetical protein
LIALVRGEGYGGFAPYHVVGWVTVLGLAFRTSWARAMIFGNAAFGLLTAIYLATATPIPTWVLLQRAVVDLGLVAFLAPTRRHGFTARGWALALVGIGAISVSQVEWWLVAPLGNAVLAPYLFGIAGILLCARWATPALLAVAAVTGIAVPEVWRGATSNVNTGMSFVLHVVSMGALVAAALLSRRGARGAGSLRALAR